MPSIWTRSPHQAFTLKVGGAPLNTAPFAGPWEAYSVLIANRTNQHLFLPDINWWVPPGVVGQVMPVPALMQATAKFSPPPGVIDPLPIAGQIASLDFFAEEALPSAGIQTDLTTGVSATSPATPSQEVGLIPNTGKFPSWMPAGYTVALQSTPQHLSGGNSDVVALGPASTTVILPANNGVWVIRKVLISSTVAVTNKVRLIDGATGFHTVILPANAQPYVYEWPGAGYQTQLGNSSLSIYTDNAGTFGVEAEMSFNV